MNLQSWSVHHWTKERSLKSQGTWIGSTIGQKASLEVMIMRYVPSASEDFLAELDRHEPARNRFYALSQQEQQRIIEQARSVKDVYEMRALVNSIRA